MKKEEGYTHNDIILVLTLMAFIIFGIGLIINKLTNGTL